MAVCRICGNQLKQPFLSLGNSPLSNSYLTEEALHHMEPYYPLEVYVCDNCYLVQLEEYETAGNIFSSNYAYFSSYSDSWLRHCREYAEMMINRFKYDQNSFVLEIASNDGYLLQYFKQHGISVLGVEPASNTAEVAIKKGISTDIVFFNTEYANGLAEKRKLADLIIGNNVLAHNPGLNDFVAGLRIALKPDGIITMEFPHLLKLLVENQFDTIYHEHFSYFSLYTAQYLFKKHGLEIFDVDELPTHGGSIRIYAKHQGDRTKQVSSTVIDLLNKEKEFGLLNIETYGHFAEKVKAIKRQLLQFLIQAKKDNKKIVGYGAPAKGNTLLNYCGIRNDFIDYTVDRSPFKQNKFLPGTHVPIKNPDYIRTDRPDYILILPWNIKDEIVEQLNFIREWEAKFIIPIPTLKVF